MRAHALAATVALLSIAVLIIALMTAGDGGNGIVPVATVAACTSASWAASTRAYQLAERRRREAALRDAAVRRLTE